MASFTVQAGVNLTIPYTNKKHQAEGKHVPVISLDDFLKTAKTKVMVIDGNSYILEPKEFSTGSWGWGFNGKVIMSVEAVK